MTLGLMMFHEFVKKNPVIGTIYICHMLLQGHGREVKTQVSKIESLLLKLEELHCKGGVTVSNLTTKTAMIKKDIKALKEKTKNL